MSASKHAVGFTLLLLFFCAGSSAQTIEVQAETGLLDEVLRIQVTGLRPGQAVIVRASMPDGEGRLWQSHAGFYADEDGMVDLSRHAPANGDYSGVNPMGLIQFMDLPFAQRGPRFHNRPFEPLVTRFSAEVDGKEVAAQEVTRRLARPGLVIRDLRAQGLVGRLFLPATPGPHPGALILGGSEGGLSSEPDAALLASHGFAALALAYFGAEGLPEALEEIPLEYFMGAIAWMQAQSEIGDKGIALLASSKGAEAALILASTHGDVRAVVTYAPSSVVWSCICDHPDKSSWSYQGQPVPFIPAGRDPTYRPPANFPIRAAINYRYRLRDREAIARAAIPVERIHGPVLLISGTDDQLWPSSEMAESIMERLRANEHPFLYRHLSYEGAGHSSAKAYLPMAGTTSAAGGRLSLGGSVEANARAQADSWPRVLEFLQTALRPRSLDN